MTLTSGLTLRESFEGGFAERGAAQKLDTITDGFITVAEMFKDLIENPEIADRGLALLRRCHLEMRSLQVDDMILDSKKRVAAVEAPKAVKNAI